jgi:alpha/beta superfamily hydrolase
LLASFALGVNIVSEQSNAEYVTFQHDKNQLSAYYLTPDDKVKVKGVILFVHGDGAMPFDAHGYYEHIWDHILDSGYAIFSWDKPGVGKSTGNWLSQSMQDRQDEVRAAISFIKDHYDYEAGQIGLMGFSQAGWIVPAVARNNKDVGFIIGIGFAMNWMDQYWYMTETRMRHDGASKQLLEKAFNVYLEDFAFFKSNPGYKAYTKRHADDEDLMFKERFGFVKKNFLSDATEDYKGIFHPGTR